MEQIGAALWAQRFILHAEISPILGQHSVFFLVIQDYRIIPCILRDQAPRRTRINRISWQKPSVLRKDSNSLTGGFSFALKYGKLVDLVDTRGRNPREVSSILTLSTDRSVVQWQHKSLQNS